MLVDIEKSISWLNLQLSLGYQVFQSSLSNIRVSLKSMRELSKHFCNKIPAFQELAKNINTSETLNQRELLEVLHHIEHSFLQWRKTKTFKFLSIQQNNYLTKQFDSMNTRLCQLNTCIHLDYIKIAPPSSTAFIKTLRKQWHHMQWK